jgi:hypothetical protein
MTAPPATPSYEQQEQCTSLLLLQSDADSHVTDVTGVL